MYLKAVTRIGQNRIQVKEIAHADFPAQRENVWNVEIFTKVGKNYGNHLIDWKMS